MPAGKERKNSMPSCIANKQGFVSAYALAVLCIILSLVSLCVLQVQVCVALLKQNQQHEMELALLHHVKTSLKRQKEEAEQKEKSKEETQEETVIEEETTLKEEMQKSETWHYEDTEAEISYEDQMVLIVVDNLENRYQMSISLNENKEIMDIEYF